MPRSRRAWGGQPGCCPASSSLRTSLLRPRLAQPWGDLSQTPSGGSLAGTRRKEPEGEAGSGPLRGAWEKQLPLQHASPSRIPPGSTQLGSQEGPSREKQEGQDRGLE